MEESAFRHDQWLAALCGFLLVVALVRHYAPRTALPAESWMLLVGVGYGLLEPLAVQLPTIRLNPEIVVSVLLPVLVFGSGRRLPVTLLLRSAGPIALLVLLGTPLSMLLIGLPAAFLLDIPAIHGLLFGAAVAATDPASVAHVLNRFPIPEQLRLILHGESLFNDALTIVAFTALAATAIGAAGLSFSAMAIGATRSVLLAIPAGLLLGWLGGLLVRRWREQNRVPGLTLTLTLPFTGFLLSERLLHASGVITVLCAALAFSHARHGPRSSGPELYDELWNFLASLAASSLYFALGAAIAAQDIAFDWVFVSVIALLLVSRALLVYGAGPLLRAQGRALPRSWRHVIMLGGLRGAVPAALVLMTPADYLYRQQLLAMVFALVAYTVIVHPLMLQRYLGRGAIDAPVSPPDHDIRETDTGLPPALARLVAASAWDLAAVAGLIAGLVFLVLEMSLAPVLLDASPWAPLRMIAAIGLGPEVLPPPAGFGGSIALVALLIHFTLSLSYAWLLAPFIENRRLAASTLLGAVFGLGLYLVNFYLFTHLFPWFEMARTGLTIFAHLVFGAVLGGSYRLMRRGAPESSEAGHRGRQENGSGNRQEGFAHRKSGPGR
ncbi:cation:proton antiporter [Alkalilimnicola sp. S0819]|uniref:cation:proton antiporter domain-containing protein n=1 Tax=Alkalilimnicola sp. S0819 TaxID=2613922 RepID=UPI00126241DD|nr:cation:proton antiporter [Alkalilimnicola sp. S0819]KAB7623639.1 hypothetical protein F3N43_08945 [Alkalilimnicola sp. S0819]MPQ16763.1 hypothetical protein [Alkalilimnicola sp. S0819]